MQRVCQQSGENAKDKSRGTPSYLRAALYRVWSPLLSLASSSSTLETEEEEVVSAKLGCGMFGSGRIPIIERTSVSPCSLSREPGRGARRSA